MSWNPRKKKTCLQKEPRSCALEAGLFQSSPWSSAINKKSIFMGRMCLLKSRSSFSVNILKRICWKVGVTDLPAISIKWHLKYFCLEAGTVANTQMLTK